MFFETARPCLRLTDLSLSGKERYFPEVERGTVSNTQLPVPRRLRKCVVITAFALYTLMLRTKATLPHLLDFCRGFSCNSEYDMQEVDRFSSSAHEQCLSKIFRESKR
jgi:hypothetical protein